MIRIISILGLLVVAQLGSAKTPFIKFNESLREKVVCGNVCANEHSGSFSLKWQRPISPSTTSQIAPDTEITIRLNDLLIIRAMNEDPEYAPGDTSAQWEVLNIVDKRTLLVKLSWKGDYLSLAVKGITPHITSPQAENLLSAPMPGTFAQSLDFLLRISNNGSTIWELDYSDTEMTATVKRKTKTVQGQTYDLDKIRVYGGFKIEP